MEFICNWYLVALFYLFMSTFLTQGIILKKEDYRDYDCKFIIYTLSRGKIIVLAKGSKKITSKLNPHLDFFSTLTLMVANSSALKRLAGVQLLKKYKRINQYFSKNISALYFLEVVNLLVKYDFKDDEVYKIIVSFFSALEDCQNSQVDLLSLNKHLFELLSHLGYRPKIKVSRQKQLAIEFHRLVTEISEKEVKSFNLLAKNLLFS